MRRLVFVVSCMAGAVAACGGNSKSGGATVSVHPADSIFIPARRERFYRDPDTNEPDITLVVSLELQSTTRFVLAQTRMDRGALAVVSDSAGLIPIFDSEAAARAYIAKVFPLDRAGGDTSVDAVAGTYGDMLALGGPTHLDLDRVLKWTVNPRSQTAGPLLLELAWEMLAAADAAPPMQQFDPMYMGAVAQRAEQKNADSLVAQVQLIGMKLTGIGSELRRRNLDENAPWQPDHSSFWTAADDALLARILRVGIANLESRLSSEAANRDVTRTWRAPAGPQLTASFLSSGKTTMDVQLSVPTVLSRSQIDEQVRGQIGNSPDPQRTTVSAAARARYARDRQEYGEDVRVYLEASRRHDDEERRLVHMRVWLKNAGDQVAKDLTVRFHIPKTVVVVPSGMARYAPMSPQEPLEPSAYENPNVRRTRFDPTPRPTYRELGQTSMYNAAQRILPDSNGRSIVEQPVVQIPGREGGEAGELMVRFPNWESVQPFDIDVEIRLAGAVANVSRLHINATRRGGV